VADDDPKAAYERLRAAHLTAVRASLEDHVARLDWPHQRIERYQTERLRSLLAYAASARPSTPPGWPTSTRPQRPSTTSRGCRRWLKQEAQNDWDAIITAPDITHARAEQVLAQQPWFSYTPAGYQIFSSGGSSGVRGVYVWDWEQFVTLACLAWRWQARAERAAGSDLRAARLGVLEAGEPPHASTPLFDIAIESSMETIVIPAAAPFDQVERAVADAKPTLLWVTPRSSDA
jgi:hypothetical protein